MTDIQALVKRALRRHNLSHEQLAVRLGIHVKTLRSWETGTQRPNPANTATLSRLSSDRDPSSTSSQKKRRNRGKQAVDVSPADTPASSVSEQATARESEDAGGSAAALSGWPCHASERADFYHRIRKVPPEVDGWRRRMVKQVSEHDETFPGAAGLDGGAVRARVDAGIVRLREVARLLAALYGRPRLGNLDDPVDELVYIILSRKTRESAYQASFEALKRRFPSWDTLLRARPRTVERLIRLGGLGEKKTRSLFGALGQLREAFGSCTLEPARDWDDERLEQFLCGLPEISRKSAYCIMMYALGRSVFPVDTHVGRILARLNPYRELGLDLDGLDHKQKQAVLADLIPPNLRYSLHVTLIAHGREICAGQRPRCGQCEIRKFCGFHRQALQGAKTSDGPTMIDLFSGAGGLSLGFDRAGFRLELALDSDADALRTLGLNHPELPNDRLVCEDIQAIDVRTLRRQLRGRRIDVIAGAPPCQGFSHIGFRSRATKIRGYRAMKDDRNYLFEAMLEVVLALRPRLVLMENVPGMESARNQNRRFMKVAAEVLENEGGYQTDLWRLNAAAFGVPQHRIRYFLVAARTRLFPVPPEAEYTDVLGTFDDDALPAIRLDEAIDGLPRREADEGEGAEAWGPSGRATERNRRRYLAKFGILSDSRVIYNHTVRYHNPRDLELYDVLRPGDNSQDAIDVYGRDDLMRYRRDAFHDKYNRLPPDRPSKTIVSHLAKDGNGYIHPTQTRSISIREAARLQSFPDDYVFCGAPGDQWVQLGNAVPPLMAEAIARSFRRCLQ